MTYFAGLIFVLCAGVSIASEKPISSAEIALYSTDQLENQLQLGEFSDVIVQVEKIITDIESTSTRYDLRLAQPLTLLGDAKLGSGDGPEALTAYERALHITRVNRGLFDVSQADIVYREAVAHASMGDRVTANLRHEYAFEILLKAYGALNPELFSGLFNIAEWHQKTDNIFASRAFFQHAAYLAKKHFLPGDERTIKALRGLAESFRRERFPKVPSLFPPENKQRQSLRYSGSSRRSMTINNFAPGERALIDIVNFKQANPESSKSDVANAFLELADWYLMFGIQNRAFPLYNRVWELLESDPKSLARVFDRPTPLYLPMPKDPAPPPVAIRGELMNGIVELTLDMSDLGTVTKYEIIRSDPKGMMDRKVTRAARLARYRPAFVESKPIPIQAFKVVHEFTYFPKVGKPK